MKRTTKLISVLARRNLPSFRRVNIRFYSKNFPLAGQPLPQTHPHLLKPNELVVGFPSSEFKERRLNFSNYMKPSSVAVIPAHATPIMTNDIPYPFRQNSNFYYLTGYNEPDGALIIFKDKNYELQMTLFVRPKDPHRELWDGPRTGPELARKFFDIDVKSINEIKQSLQEVLPKAQVLYYDTSANAQFTNILASVLPRNLTVESSRQICDQIRGKKSKNEIQIIQKCADITAEAYIVAMQSTAPGLSEGHIEAILEYQTRLRGCKRLAYPPVIASGNNANTMHYVMNDQILQDGDLLLIDAGGEYHNYPCDITRTWPINGKFTEEQRLIYDAVLRVQKKCIEMVKPGVTFTQVHKKSCELIFEELKRLGITKDTKDLMIYYPHHIGHPLGMDIHEVEPDYNVKFEPGMMITIEPGIYISKDSPAPERFKGIGVRIEDNLLITENGNHNITHKTPKEPEEIEAICTSEEAQKIKQELLKVCRV